jgi:16S rRNA (cytosine967-C5)-methyltransferase
MHPRALIDLATELLRAVLRFDAPADRQLTTFFRAHRALGSRERHAIAETVYAVLRERLRWQHLAQSGRGPLERRLVLLAWRGQPGYLDAALEPDERGWVASAQAVPPASLPDAQRHNLPAWLAEALRPRLGEDDFWPLAQALVQPAGLDLRVNTVKAKREAVQAAFAAQGWACEATPWSPWGLRLAGKPALQRSQPFEQGEVEVQDEGSQLLALLTEARRGEMVADFCAGAGGKTLALGAMMRNTGRLYAFDTSAHRLAALKPRLARSGLSNVYPVAISHERDERIKRLAGKLDRVLVDAPCSGLGTLRRNPDLKWRQDRRAVEELAAKQTAILASAARLLKPGGRLVYATCSLLVEENDAIADAFAAAQPGFEALDVAEVLGSQRVPDASTLTEGGRLRLWPHRHGTDGFFAAVWQRTAG